MNKGDSEREKACADRLRERGLRVTPQRIAIYGELLQSKDHPSTTAVYNRVRGALPAVSFDTVYRTLLLFSGKGIIKTVEGTGEETRFEPDPECHHHFRCLRCHGITDFEDDALDSIVVPRALEKRFDILNRRVVLEGICESCRGKCR